MFVIGNYLSAIGYGFFLAITTQHTLNTIYQTQIYPRPKNHSNRVLLDVILISIMLFLGYCLALITSGDTQELIRFSTMIGLTYLLYFIPIKIASTKKQKH